jgi:outer membrane biosynthesis protein TonB
MAENSRAGRRVRWVVLVALLGGGAWVVRSRRMAAAEQDPWPAPRPPADPWPARQDAEKPAVAPVVAVVPEPGPAAPEPEPPVPAPEPEPVPAPEPPAPELEPLAPEPEAVAPELEPSAPEPETTNPLFAPVVAGDLPPINGEASLPRPSPTPRPRRVVAARDYGPGSAAPLPDGSAPGPAYTIKGNAGSMLFHSPSSPYYERTRAEVWFQTVTDARAAGFTEWVPRKRTPS